MRLGLGAEDGESDESLGQPHADQWLFEFTHHGGVLSLPDLLVRSPAGEGGLC